MARKKIAGVVVADVIEVWFGLFQEARPHPVKIKTGPLGELLEERRTRYLDKERKETRQIDDVGRIRRKRDAGRLRRLLNQRERLLRLEARQEQVREDVEER